MDRFGGKAGRGALLAALLALSCGRAGPLPPRGGVAVDPAPGPAPGDPAGACPVPAEAALEDSSHPTTVVGDGTPESCTPEALEAAVRKAGVVTFACGPDPVVITLARELKIVNDAGAGGQGDLLLDGGGKVSLSGGGRTRILYQNGCDPAQHWITDHCQDFPHPRLVLQRLRFLDGATSDPDLGGGAVYVRSGQLKVADCVFEGNRAALEGPDVGGGALYAVQQAGPVFVVHSTFGGAPGKGNVASNGGALGSIGVSFTVLNSLLSHNQAVGRGMNPAQAGTPGGGSGGAIYNDGDTYTLQICGSQVHDNAARELAGAVFYVSNDRTGTMVLDRSAFRANPGKDVQALPGFFVLARDSQITATTIE
jgi:hypothetical protein